MLDRTWYNALVDDDGSGLKGSVWDKADIANLLDSIDAELKGPLKGRAAWTPILQTNEGSTISAATTIARFAVAGDLVLFSVNIAAISVPTTTGMLRVWLPPGYYPRDDAADETGIRIYAGASEWAYATALASGFLGIHRAGDAPFTPGTYYVIGTGFYFYR